MTVIMNAILMAMNDVKKTTREKLDQVRQEFVDQFNRVGDFLIGLQKRFTDLGGDLVRGIIAGIKAAGGALYETITGILGNALKSGKDFLGIKSPSRKAHEEIGMPWVQGIVSGTVAGEKVLDEAMKRISQRMMESQPGTHNADSGTFSGQSPYKGDNGETWTFNVGEINNSSPIDLEEIGRRLLTGHNKKRAIPNS